MSVSRHLVEGLHLYMGSGAPTMDLPTGRKIPKSNVERFKQKFGASGTYNYEGDSYKTAKPSDATSMNSSESRGAGSSHHWSTAGSSAEGRPRLSLGHYNRSSLTASGRFSQATSRQQAFHAQQIGMETGLGAMSTLPMLQMGSLEAKGKSISFGQRPRSGGHGAGHREGGGYGMNGSSFRGEEWGVKGEGEGKGRRGNVEGSKGALDARDDGLGQHVQEMDDAYVRYNEVEDHHGHTEGLDDHRLSRNVHDVNHADADQVDDHRLSRSSRADHPDDHRSSRMDHADHIDDHRFSRSSKVDHSDDHHRSSRISHHGDSKRTSLEHFDDHHNTRSSHYNDRGSSFGSTHGSMSFHLEGHNFGSHTSHDDFSEYRRHDSSDDFHPHHTTSLRTSQHHRVSRSQRPYYDDHHHRSVDVIAHDTTHHHHHSTDPIPLSDVPASEQPSYSDMSAGLTPTQALELHRLAQKVKMAVALVAMKNLERAMDENAVVREALFQHEADDEMEGFQ
ncbi:hypothetical protein BC829DRAFT_385606 [Chytridium lagenaria]|nr:hypothetical protein BC829DRAFT_385606 [Chytridium lagenaria]